MYKGLDYLQWFIFHLGYILYWFSRYGDRIVAVKVLHRGSTYEERASLENRFAREVNMMSRVKHENLVKVSFKYIHL